MQTRLRFGMITAMACLAMPIRAQIDPAQRELVQLGYYKEIIGHAPLSGYAVYYRNEPHFIRTNLTLRAAIAPVYADTELGIKDALGANTDLGLGLSGGGFAYSYNEIRSGTWFHQESWTGHGGGAAASVYHRFNPDHTIPLYGILRGGFQYALYERDDTTAPTFKLPDDQPWLTVRAGLRYGGQEFALMPEMGLELSAWVRRTISTGLGSIWLRWRPIRQPVGSFVLGARALRLHVSQIETSRRRVVGCRNHHPCGSAERLPDRRDVVAGFRVSLHVARLLFW